MELGPLQSKWIEALESSKYLQGEGYLCSKGTEEDSGDRYCCLGVACEVIGVEKKDVPGGCYEYQGYRGQLTSDLRDKIGLASGMGAKIGDEAKSLAIMNDDGTTFAEIARILRENPGDYFVVSK